MSRPERIPLEVLFGNPERTAPRLSPDGTKLAFLAPDEGVLNVWVGPIDDVTAARPLTKDRLRGIRMFSWAHDQRSIIYMQDTGGDENWRLHVVDVDTGDDRDATPFPGVQTQLLNKSKRVPGSVIVGINRDDARWHDAYRLDLQTLELELVVKNEGFDSWMVDEDLQVRGATRPRADGGQTYLLRDDDGRFEVFLEIAPDDVVLNVSGFLGFSGDGRQLYFSSAEDCDLARLIRIDAATGKREVLAEHPTNDLEVAALVFHPDTIEPQIVAFASPRRTYQVLDPTMVDEWAAIGAVCPGDPLVASRTDDDALWLLAFVVDDGPVRYYLWNRAEQEATFLLTNQPALEGYTLAQTEPFSFTASDGLTVSGLITFPPGRERKDLPAVLEVHGGPWGARHVWGFLPHAQWLANMGYVCINIDYRGSGGYGKAFLNASAQEWAGKMHSDLIDGCDWVVEQGWVDKERIAIFGGSYGGYAALVGATFTPDYFRCAVDIVGPSNLITLLKSIPPYWVGVATQFHKLLGHPEKDADFLWERSPLSRVDDIVIPLLIAQGANDPRVKQEESEQIVDALRQRGIEHTYLLYEDEGHGFARPENNLDFHRKAEEFLLHHLPPG